MGPDSDTVRKPTVLGVPNLVIDVELNLLPRQCGRFGVSEQFPQNLPIGGVDNHGPDLHDTGNTLLGKGQHVLVLLAALECHHAIPKAGDRQNRLHAIIDILRTQVLRFPHLTQAFIAGQLPQFVFRHHNSITSISSESVTLVAISWSPLALHLA